ncbi:MAG: hypothetical protein ACD_23C00124G0001, partial [uncultured bacterium]
MSQLCQPKAGNEGQQPAIGNGACVIRGMRLTAKGKGDRLCHRAACQIVGAIPGCHQRQHQQQHKRQARGQLWCQPVRGQLNGPGTQPIGQQCIDFRRHAAQRRMPPVCAATGQFGHVTKRGDVVALPGRTPQKAGQHVGQAKQQQRQARQALDAGLCDDGRCG